MILAEADQSLITGEAFVSRERLNPMILAEADQSLITGEAIATRIVDEERHR